MHGTCSYAYISISSGIKTPTNVRECDKCGRLSTKSASNVRGKHQEWGFGHGNAPKRARGEESVSVGMNNPQNMFMLKGM